MEIEKGRFIGIIYFHINQTTTTTNFNMSYRIRYAGNVSLAYYGYIFDSHKMLSTKGLLVCYKCLYNSMMCKLPFCESILAVAHSSSS